MVSAAPGVLLQSLAGGHPRATLPVFSALSSRSPVLSKRPFLACAGALSLTFGCWSSAAASPPVAWDVRMGPSVTGATGTLSESLDRASGGFDGGVAIRWPRSTTSWGVQAEGLFASRARSFPDVIGFRRRLDVRYAQFHLLARASLRRTGRLRPYALAGPYFAWRLSSRIAPGRYAGDEPVDPGDVRARDAGAVIGLGADLGSGRGRATVELRAGLGFVDVLEARARVDGTYRVLTLILAVAPGEDAD